MTATSPQAGSSFSQSDSRRCQVIASNVEVAFSDEHSFSMGLLGTPVVITPAWRGNEAAAALLRSVG